MTGNIEGILVQLLPKGTIGIMTNDYLVHELDATDRFEYLWKDGTWVEDIPLYFWQGWFEFLGDDEDEDSVPLPLGMPARHKVSQSDE